MDTERVGIGYFDGLRIFARAPEIMTDKGIINRMGSQYREGIWAEFGITVYPQHLRQWRNLHGESGGTALSVAQTARHRIDAAFCHIDGIRFFSVIPGVGFSTRGYKLVMVTITNNRMAIGGIINQ